MNSLMIVCLRMYNGFAFVPMVDAPLAIVAEDSDGWGLEMEFDDNLDEELFIGLMVDVDD